MAPLQNGVRDPFAGVRTILYGVRHAKPQPRWNGPARETLLQRRDKCDLRHTCAISVEARRPRGEFAALAHLPPMKRKREARRVVAGVGIAVAVGLLAHGLYPADLPETHNPDFVDNVSR